VTEPAPPVNVRLTLGDGRVVPVDCVYTGVDDTGLARWTVVVPDHLAGEQLAGLAVDAVPPETAIDIPLSQ
jgi:hypothetical protein